MNLWDLEIKTLSCGWEKTYQDSLLNAPEGLQGEYFYHPVLCHSMIIEEFNQLKIEAKQLISIRKDLDTNTFIQKLIKIDARLHFLLLLWTGADDYYDNSSFDPKTALIDDGYSDYINPDCPNDGFSNLRVLFASIE